MGEFVGVIMVLGIIFFFTLVYYVPVGLWISAVSAGVRLSLFTLVGMRLRRVPPSFIILPLIQGRKAGIDVNVQELEAHYLSGGNVTAVVSSLIAAQRAGLNLDFRKAAAIDIAGRDVLQAVQMCVNPKVIPTPMVAAVAKNGIQVRATARITVRANIERLVGGAGADTIIARVGEGIVSTIGSSNSHKDVFENPSKIAEIVLKKGLDSGTAYEILSIDIADVDVGRNIGAELQTDQAMADKKIAQAQAEERHAFAVAREQEMKALEAEMRARLVEAEAEVPKAMADAAGDGRFRLSKN